MSRRRTLLLETCEDRILCNAAPNVTMPAPAHARLGDTFTSDHAVSPIAHPATVQPDGATAATALHSKVQPAELRVPFGAFSAAPAAPAAITPQTHAAGNFVNSTASTLTSEQRAAVTDLVKDSTQQIYFQENVGQFPEGVLYGFKTTFGSMLVYNDHLRILVNQYDATTGAVGVQAVDITFPGGIAPWQIAPGGTSPVAGSYQQPGGTTLVPKIFSELTLKNVYQGVDLRLYSAEKGILEFDWIVAKAQDYDQIRIAAVGQDGMVFNPDGSATLKLRYQDLTLHIPEVYQVIDGQKHALGGAMVAGETPGTMRYQLTGQIVRDQPLVIDPNVVWSTYFDLNDSTTPFDSYVFSVNANANGTYVSGWVGEVVTNAAYGAYMQVNAGFSQGTVANQTYVYRLSNDGLNITAWTSTGVTSPTGGVTNQKLGAVPADLELFPDGRVIVGFGNGLVQIYSADLATRPYSGTPVTVDTLNSIAVVDDNTFYVGGRVAAAIPVAQIAAANIGPDSTFGGTLEGVIIRYTNATTTPTPSWATYVGGDGQEYFTAVAMTPDMTKLVFATSTSGGTLASFGTLVNAVDSTISGTELIVGVLPEQATKPAAFSVFSFLGGTGNEGTVATNTMAALVTATNTYFYVGGTTDSTDLPGTAGGAQTTNGGGTFDAFASRIPLNGSAGVGFQSTYMGGAGQDRIGGIAYDTRADKLLMFGTTTGSFPTLDTVPSSNYYDSTFGGGTYDIFVATVSGTLTTKDYATYIGGSSNDYLGQTGALVGQGHVVYSAATGLTYLATTVHSSDLPSSVIGTPPGKDTNKSNAANDTHFIVAFNINTFDYGDAPVSYENGTPAREAISNSLHLGATVDAEATGQNSANALGDDTFTTADEDGVSSLALLFTADSSYSVNVSVLNNSGATQTLRAWIDFNRDGLFQVGETASVSVATSAAQQNVTLTWASLPPMTAGLSFLRLRLTTAALTDTVATANVDERSIGNGGTGEIEDYALVINTLSSIAGTVYRDTNNDGAKAGASETGIAGATVTLTGTNDLGTAVNVTATSDASGNYTFSGLRPSNAAGYTLTETQPAGFLDGKNTVGTNGGVTVNNPASDVISGLVIAPSTTATGYLFGELAPASVAGTVYHDLNANAAQDAGEAGISGVTVTLTGTDDLGNAVNTAVATNGTGAYVFNNLRPGTYTLTETQPAAYLDGKETAGTLGGTVNNTAISQTISTFTIAAGDTGTGYLFGEVQAGSLAGTVYRDLNNNGVVDAGETGVSGATVTLTGTNDFGQAVNVVATTSAAGAYSFAGLRPGTYVLTETQPAGLLDGKDTLGTVNGTANGTAGNDTFTAVVLPSAGTGANYNFGELPASSVAGRVFDDHNNNGVVDAGENGIGSISIQLNGTDDLGAAVNLSTTTAADGTYSFGNLRPGSYTVKEPAQPAGFLDGKETAGTLGGSTATNEQIGPFNLAANTAATGYTFGELTPSSLSGTVYVDTNNNGVVDAGETLLPGINITLTGTDDLGQAVSLSTSTNASGAYAFNNVRPGTYTVTETQPGAYLDGKETVGTQASGTINNAANSNTISAITLVPATTGSGNNFGELGASSLGGSIWSDANNNGVFDAGETAIVGATVTLTGTDDRGNAVSTPATTSATGAYIFANLRPGTYALTETQPAGFLDGKDTLGSQGGTLGNDTVTGITLAQGVTGTNNNFAELAPAALSGTVYRDLNNDGAQAGAGETGIAGVTVTLTGTNDLGAAVNVTATTDASGNYSFANVRPGTYTLTETQPAAFLDGKETAGTLGGTVNNAAISQTISGFTVNAGANGTGYLFGELPAASVSGTVFQDDNADGVKQAAESGIGSVNVTLTGTDDFGNAVSVSTATDAAGAYSFGNLRPGTYTLTETQPAAYLDGKETAGTLGGTVNNTAVSQTISTFTVASGNAGTGYLFAEVQANSLAGAVYRDLNNNGIIDAGETGVSGATITLTGTDDFGQAVSTTTITTAAGAYSFAGLRPGTYALTETQPAGLLDGKDALGTVNGAANGTAGNDTFTTVTLKSAGTGANYNFGELPGSSVAGRVFDDRNNNGIVDAGENGIGSISIQLNGTDDLGNAVSLSTTTAADGSYSFGNLRPGSYTVKEPSQPAGFLDGKETAGTLGGSTATNEQIGAFNLVANTATTGYTFGELTPSSLSGTVYVDTNNNGVVDAGETLLPGINITLTGTDDLGQAVSLSTSTNASGAYAFNNVRPGTYTVTETQPGAYLDGKETVGTQASGTINNAANSNTISAITLVPATTGSGNNFGELGASSLGGSIWSDANNNGVFDAGETAIVGATVTLTGTDDRGNAVSTTATTSATGAYVFANLRPGTYALTETQPAGFLDGKDTLGSQGGTLGNDTVTGITLAQGVTGTNNNFAELAPAALSGTVYRDLNNDGAQSGAGETGIAGVTVTLTGTNDLGAAVNIAATTDASGNYSFANVRPGTYTLTETQPAAFLDGKETAGTLGGTVNNGAISQTISGFTVNAGANGTGYLFGELPAASLSGTVFQDDNADGAKQAAESGIGSVNVTLTGTDDFGNAVNVTATTDAAGAYSFSNLRPGTYTLTETQPAAYLDGKETAGTLGGTVNNTAISQTISTFTVAAGNAGTGYLFAEVQANSLAGTVYRDLNNNGIIDAGETGVSGATITLTGTDDFGQAVSTTTITTAAGAYSFAGLRPGTYALTETQPAGLLDGKDTLGTVNGAANGTAGNDTFTTVTLKSAGTGANYNFGELPGSSVAGRVFDDRNNNGVVDAGENGIGSITLQLTGTDDLGTAVSLSTTTAADGSYSFGNLRPGSYTVKEPTQPAGFLDGKETAGTLGGSTATNEQIGPFNLAANTAATGYTFGELTPSSLSGTVYVDTNNNGVVDAGETLLPGINITLTGTDDLGQAVSLSTSTNASGAYAFNNVRPGTYTVTETQPGAYLDGKETVGTQASGTINNAANSNTISAITLVPATTGSGNNFGELGASSLGGSIWSDANNNGVFDAGETAIVGATVTLTGTDDRGNAVSTTATTSATGAYIFANLRPGTYALTETQPAGFLNGKDTLGSQGGTLGNDTVTGITLAQGVTGTNNNFAELAPAALSGTVYRDLNNDGAQAGAGETGIAGVTVTLTGTNDLGAAVNVTATTDASGNYSFANVRPGTYTLTETQPAAFLDGKETAGTLGGTVNNGAISQTISGFTVNAGANGTGYLFGELPAASVSGTVYRDDNNDGAKQAAEPGLGGVNVALSGTDDFGNAVSLSATTAADGSYAFNNLRPGSYTLTETQPAAYLDGKETAGPLGGTVNNAANSDTISAITVAVGANGTGNLFGELQGGGVTGNVYVDLNNNGVLDAGEAPISGVTITLTGTDDRGNAVSTTATSDASGAYAFANLRPGTYTVTETQPAAYLDGKDTAGAPGGGVATNDAISGITIGSGVTSAGNIFGELPGTSVLGSVYVDANNNGVFDAGETALPGVTITLTGTDDLGQPVSLTTTTGATGAFAFAGLRPGTYAVTETQPAGYLDGKDTAGTPGGGVAGNDTVTGITLTSGVASTGNTFGELRPASLAGSVYVDANNNGTLDAGETAITGATITLTGTDDLGHAVSLTATTGAGGGYAFNNLRPGTYTLTETQPAGYLDGKDALGTQGGTLGNDTVSGISLTEGTTGTGNSFGELQGASIAGSVYRDANNDGVLNAGESGVTGVTITLTGTDDLGQAVSLSTTTGAGGAYAFSNLRPGNYSVAETQPAGLLDGTDTAGAPGGGTAGNDIVTGITLVSGRPSTGNNFGELDAATISGSVYIDANNDGIFQAGETPRAGVTLTLSGTDDRGGAVSLTTTTDATGLYTFANLRPGSYSVNETQPAGLLDGKDTAGAVGGGTAGNDVITGITLIPARTSASNNFGELRPASLGGSIWSDTNNNGVLDAGETPIAGASVTLTGTDDLGNAVSVTATTNASGAYVFNNLRPGSYALTETQPAGFLDGKDTLGTQGGTLGNDTVTGITLNEGATGTGNNFAELTPAALSGTVYRDLNNDGAQAGAGETGIAGVTVTLTGTNDLGAAVNIAAITDASGNYSFANVRPGTYTLTETQPAAFLDGKETAGTLGGTVNNAAISQTISGFTVNAGANGTGYLFGELPAASVSGTVFQDDNADGAKQAAESGIGSVNVTLTGTDDFGNAVSVSTATDAAGAYSFSNLRPGTYTLTETQPAAYLDGKETAGTLGGTVNNTAVSQTISTFTVATGNAGTGYLFAEVQANSLAGAVYRDLNNNGIIDAGETGVSGATITLTGTDDFGQAVSTTTITTAAGAYSFAGLRPGTYALTETQPAGLLDGKDALGTVNGAANGTAGNDTFTTVTLQSAGTGANYNFGELPGSSVAGRVFDDRNNNGIVDAGENGIGSISIQLNGTDDLGNAVSLSTTTAADGSYSFGNLRPGSYTVKEPSQPAGFLDGKETAGTLGGSTATNEQIGAFNLVANTATTGYTFGELTPSSLSGTVYVDTNNNGVVDAGETLLPGINITLTGTDDLGQAVSLSTSTNASGAYTFNNVRPGTYTVTETQPGAYLDGKETVGTQASGTINNAANSNTISAITLVPATTGSGNNFGELGASSLGGSIWSDANNNGVFDAGETAIVGATVTLTGTDDRGNAVSTTATTSATGAYVFANLRPGTYALTETQPAGFLDGKDTLGSQGGTLGNDTVTGITLAQGVTGTNNNFAELAPAALSGTVYRDLNNDGAQSGAGETGIAGTTVTVTGTDDLGQAVSLSTLTDASGNYAFANLRPGTYTLTETQPAGLLDGKETAGLLGGTVDDTTSSNTISGVTVTAGANGTGNLFGELPPSSLAGSVYYDANNNGVRDAGEAPISGVTITLTGTDDRGNAVTFTTPTDGTGAYAFAGLRPGSYAIAEAQPAGFSDGKDAAGTAGGSAAAQPGDAISGIALSAATSATGYTFGEIANSTLSGAVYDDANNNGLRDAGEAGIAGIQVQLTGTDFLGNAVSVTATTDATGAYSFANVAPSNAAGYTLTELSQPAGYLDGKETAGTTGGTVDNTTNSQTITGVLVPAGQTSSGNLFGEFRGSVLSGVIYRDLNNDGTQAGAGETGVSGVTVTVTGTDDRGHAVSFTTTSDATGAYSFANLRPSDLAGYTLTETQPAGLLDGKNTVGTQGGSTVNNPATDVIQTVAITPGTTGTANNFGELPPASLSGFEYNDANNDGVRDAGEALQPGVTITLTGTDDLGNAVSTTAVTDATGAYSFSNLRPGSYTLTETQPAGLLDGKETAGSQGSGTVDNTTNSNTISAISLTAGQTGTDNNFADLTAANFSGAVYRDLNNDGVRDAGETGIAGVSITITGTDDRGVAVNVTVMTDANGDYDFSNLRPGSYTVTETQPAGFLDGADTRGTISGTTPGTVSNDQFGGLTLAPGATGTNYIFGELPAAGLSGTVFRDDNNDGLHQAGEPPIGGVTVTLTGTDDLGNTVSLSMQSAADGTYSFTGLRPGTYALTETQPGAFLDGKDTAGSLGGTSAASPGDTISGIVVASQQNGTGYNFGELAGSSIAGTAFVDANNNGALDAGETLLPGVSVTLTGTNDLGQSVTVSTNTDAGGAYTFGNLRPGTYTVSETQPAGYLDGRDAAGTAGGTAAAVPGDAISAITLPSNTAATGYTFGELRAASLSGAVFADTNNNGVLDAGETGIATTITLTGTNDLGQAVTVSVTSDPVTGAYNFSGLRPGTYVLTETQPAAFLDGRDTLGNAGGTLTNDKVSAIAVHEGTTGSGYNFGEVAGSSLTGTVYRDDNNNGLLDAGEARLSGVTIKVTGTDDLGNAVSLTATTDASGAYSFANLRPSDAAGYTITETEPAGFLMGRNTVGTQGGATTNNPPTSFIQTVQINAGTAGTGNNFGELAPSSLSGTTYIDANNNGVLDAGETRLPGVAVTLTGTDDLGHAISVSTTTDGTGAYVFNGLRPGTYTVSETQPAGYLDGQDTAGTANGTAAVVPGDAISAITLASNTPATGYNFGELRGASLAGVVFRDDNNDGAPQAGEPGAGGVSVRLRGVDDLGNVIDTTLTTQPDGTYAFTNLRPGTYRVTETQPAGLLDGKDALGTNSGTLANDDASGIVLREGDTATGYTFGELNASGITGTVFDDRNNNGLRDPGEAGIQGVAILLTGTDDLGQAVSLSTNTDPSGNYQFTGLRPGTYTLTETQPAGYLDGRDTAGTSGGTVGLPPSDQISAITLPSNTNAGNYRFAELTPAQVSGAVYHDDNNDGAQQAGETGIGGVGVTLTGTDDLGNSISLSTNTAPDGTYSFASLRPGTYTLTETQPAGYLDGQDTAGTQGGSVAASPSDSISSLTVTPGQSGTGNNFGELSGSSITGNVFDDRNDDGAPGAGETGLPGVSVTLTGTNDLGQPVTLTTMTDPAGAYTFANLRPGTYTLTESQPAGYLDGTDTFGNLGGTASPVPGDTITGIVVASNQTGSGYNFAELAPSSIGGSVFTDLNNDGVRDPGESGIGGVTVTLTGTNDLGQAVNIALNTAPDGSFDFTNLRPGTYTVTETQPPAYADGKDALGTLNGTPGNDTAGNIVVTPGQTGTGYTFGEQLTSVTGTVFIDHNRDGVQNPGETGLAGVTITLLDKNGNFGASTTTGPGGDYAFATIVSGPYRLVETQPTGYGSSTADIVDINVTPTGSVVRFGETVSSLSGTVYFDANASGALNAGDPGLSGITVTLTGTDTAGAAVNRTMTAGADGSYLFDNLLSGNYTISATQAVGYNDGAETAGTFSGSLATNDSISAITVPTGKDGAGYNFGELGMPITGVIFRDDNHDGVRDPGEVGLPGVTIQLIDPQTMIPIATVTTDPSGRYVFDNQPPGSYIVRETQPPGYGDTTPNDQPVTVGAPGPGDLNFGEKLGSLAGTVYLDRNNDGMQGAGEPGIANVKVTLTGVDANGQPVTRIAMTNATGGYTFDNLLSGNYTVTETQPAGYADGKDSIGTSNGTPNGQDSTKNIALGAGVAATGYNFGELGAPDLTIAKTDGVTQVKPGQLITYTVTVSNQGVQDAAGVVVTDQFPAGDLQFVSASNGGVYNATTHTITWQLGDVTGSDQQTITLTVVAKIRSVIPAGDETVTNTVTVHDDGKSGPDANPKDNTAHDTDRILAAPDLYVTKTDNLEYVKVGQQSTYTISGGNAGQQVGEGVIITDTLPPGLRFISASNGGSLVNGQVVWNVGNLAPGQRFNLTVTVAVESVPGAAVRDVVNTVTINDRFGSFEDPTPSNNTATDHTQAGGETAPGPRYAFDTFHNHAEEDVHFFHDPYDLHDRFAPYTNPTDVYRPAILPVAPVYSGAADPGATLVVEIYNANGERIGAQTVMVDAGGNWLANFPSSAVRDYPASVRIVELPAPYSPATGSGRNLRNYFAPVLNPGQFNFGGQDSTPLDPRAVDPLLNTVNLANPLELGPTKYGGELLPTAGAPGGY